VELIGIVIIGSTVLVVVILFIIWWWSTSNDQDSLGMPDDQVATTPTDHAARPKTFASKSWGVNTQSKLKASAKRRILVVEDAPDISNLLKIYFTSQGYEVLSALHGQAALEICRKTPLNIALLDVNLPDIEGFEIGRALRASLRTRHTAIVFLTARGDRQDRLLGLRDIQADYYIIKPFDIEEVHIIVKNVLDAQQRKNLLHPITNLPTADLIHDQVQGLLPRDGWALALVRINGFDTFTQAYGNVVGEDILKFLAVLMNETLNELGDETDFLGHMMVGPEFVLISTPDRTRAIIDRLISQFDAEVGLNYSYKHRKQGYIEVTDDDGNLRKLPLMSLSIGVLTSQDGPFGDPHELWKETYRTLQQASADSSAHEHRSTAYYGRAPEKSKAHESGSPSIGAIDSVSLQTQIADTLLAASDALLAVSIECDSTDALVLLDQNALTVPHAREINRLGSADIVALVPTSYIDESVEQMLEHFYNHPQVQEREAVLSYGWASGSYPSANAFVEAVARDHLRQRREQMLDISNEPAILSLQPGRRELLQRYEQAQALCETYRESFKAQQGRYDQAVQTEIDRLTSIVNHDLNSGFMSMQRAVDDTAARLPTEAADALHFLHAVEEHIILCTAWHRSIIELGAGGVVQRQELSPGPWLAKHLAVLSRCVGGQVQLDIDLANVPDAMVDKSLLLVACLHLLRAVDTAGASILRVSTTPDQHEDRFDIMFTDDGDADQRLACLAAHHPTQRAAFPWEYQNLALIQRVLQLQDIKVRCEQHDAWFQMYWSIPKPSETLADSFLSLEELRSGVVALEQEAEHLEKAISALEKLQDDTTPEDARPLLLPFVEHLEHSLGVMREQFLPSVFTTLHMVDTDVVRRIPRLILYCYLLVRNLLLPLKGSPVPVEQVNVNAEVQNVVDMLEHKRAQLDVRFQLAPEMPFVPIATTDLEQVFMNLIKNAAEATKGSGELYITTAQDEQQVVIQLRDTGDGIPPRYKDNIFQLNFSTKGRGTNSGVGLYAVRTIVERAGGHVCVASASRDAKGQIATWQRGFSSDDAVQWDNPGTLFRIELPIARKA
jgi:signal transduction histidine kinase/FixJ family two-component response regulator